MLTQNYNLQTFGSHEVKNTTIVLRDVVENQLEKAKTPNPENQIWAPLSRKKYQVQLPWPSKLGW